MLHYQVRIHTNVGDAMKYNNSEKVRKINCLTNELDKLYHRAARKLNVSDSILCLLYVIYEKGNGCLLYDVCRESGLKKQTVNSAIRKLENGGILYLEHNKGRSKKICLTEKGKIYVNNTAARLYEAECNAFADWSETESEQYIMYMKKYINSLSVQIEKLESEDI